MGDTLKIVRKNGFTVLPNTPARDPRLSLATKGLYWVMMSLPDGWEFSIRGLASVAGDGHGSGRSAIGAAIKSLEEAGYLLREQRHDENGKFVGNTYVLYDESTTPLAGFPATVFPSTENLPPDLSKYRDNNIPPIVPQGGRRAHRRTQEPREAPEWKPERFSRLWEAYPHNKRGNKQKAMNMWDRLHASDQLLDEISRDLKKLMSSEAWRDGVAIPHVSTFLNPLTEKWKDAENLDGGGAQFGHNERPVTEWH